MTLQEIRDAFEARYKVECFKRNVKQLELDDKLIALFMSEAQQDIQRRHRVVRTSSSVTITSGSGTLPSNFGRIIAVKYDDDFLEQKPYQELLDYQLTTSDSDALVYAIDQTGATATILVYPTGVTSVTVYYYPEYLYYQPSGDTSQEWGSFSGTAFSGSLNIPVRYAMAVQYYMLSQLFDDIERKYEREMGSLRESQLINRPKELKYNIGGFTKKTDVATGTSSSTTSTSGAVYQKSHVLRVNTSTDTITQVQSSKGWTGGISQAMASDVVTVTSTSADFVEGLLFVDCTTDYSWVIDSTTQIRVTLYPPAGTTSVGIEIYVP